MNPKLTNDNSLAIRSSLDSDIARLVCLLGDPMDAECKLPKTIFSLESAYLAIRPLFGGEHSALTPLQLSRKIFEFVFYIIAIEKYVFSPFPSSTLDYPTRKDKIIRRLEDFIRVVTPYAAVDEYLQHVGSFVTWRYETYYAQPKPTTSEKCTLSYSDIKQLNGLNLLGISEDYDVGDLLINSSKISRLKKILLELYSVVASTASVYLDRPIDNLENYLIEVHFEDS